MGRARLMCPASACGRWKFPLCLPGVTLSGFQVDLFGYVLHGKRAFVVFAPGRFVTNGPLLPPSRSSFFVMNRPAFAAAEWAWRLSPPVWEGKAWCLGLSVFCDGCFFLALASGMGWRPDSGESYVGPSSSTWTWQYVNLGPRSGIYVANRFFFTRCEELFGKLLLRFWVSGQHWCSRPLHLPNPIPH